MLRALIGCAVLGPGDRVPDVSVWRHRARRPRPLAEVLGAGHALLCFYLWDWSPT